MRICVSSVRGGSFATRAWIAEPVSVLQEKMSQLTKGDLTIKAAGTHRRAGGKTERLGRRYPSLYLGGGNLAELGEHRGEPAEPSNPGEFRNGGRTATASHSMTGQATEIVYLVSKFAIGQPPREKRRPPARNRRRHTRRRVPIWGMLPYRRAGTPPQDPRGPICREIGTSLTIIQTK